MTEYVEITVKNKVVKNKKVSEVANVLICLSGLSVAYILFNVLPGRYNTEYTGDDFFIDNIYSIVATCLMMIIGILLKINNYKPVFGIIKFYDDKIQLSDKAIKLNYRLEDIDRIRYSYFDSINYSVSEKPLHWITIKTKGKKEFYSEFFGNDVQMDLVKLLIDYKNKGNDVEIEVIS